MSPGMRPWELSGIGAEVACAFCGAMLPVQRRGWYEKRYCDGTCAYRAKVGWHELTCTACGATFMGNKGKHCPACRRMMAV